VFSNKVLDKASRAFPEEDQLDPAELAKAEPRRRVPLGLDALP